MYNKTPTNPYTFCRPGFEVKLILMVVKDVGPTIFSKNKMHGSLISLDFPFRFQELNGAQ